MRLRSGLYKIEGKRTPEMGKGAWTGLGEGDVIMFETYRFRGEESVKELTIYNLTKGTSKVSSLFTEISEYFKYLNIREISLADVKDLIERDKVSNGAKDIANKFKIIKLNYIEPIEVLTALWTGSTAFDIDINASVGVSAVNYQEPPIKTINDVRRDISKEIQEGQKEREKMRKIAREEVQDMECMDAQTDYKIYMSKEELTLCIVQLGARRDGFKSTQKEEALKGNVRRVVELEEVIKELDEVIDKLQQIRIVS